MQTLAGKNLLFLGGSMLDRHALRIAKSMGIRTVVANFYPPEKSPAKYEADKAFEIDNTDEQSMLELIKREHIDGIFGGYTDSNLPTFQRLCELGGFACYGTKEQFETTIDKKKFMDMCRKHRVLTVEEYDPQDITEDADIQFPLFVKPTDNSGCRGCSSCNNFSEYLESLEFAKKYSPSKTVTIEKYYDYNQYGDFMACYSMRNGVVTLASLGDREMFQSEKNSSPLPAQLMYPSKYLDAYLRSTNPSVIKMLEEERFLNGTLFMQGFTNGTEFRFFEMGYRQNGSQQFVLTEYFNRNNTLKEAIIFALTGNIDLEASERDDARFSQPACNLVIYLKPGIVKEIQGINKVLSMKGVINYTPWILPGSTVGAQGTLGQSLMRFHVIGEDHMELEKRIETIRSLITAVDSQDNPMIVEI